MTSANGTVKILHIVDGLGVGGAEVQLSLLLRHLPAERFSHSVCHLGARADLASEIRGLGAHVTDLSQGGRRVLIHSVRGLHAEVRRFHPALIHTDGLFSNHYGRLAGRFYGLPVLTTVGNMLLLPTGEIPPPPARSFGRRLLWGLNPATGRRWTTHFMAITHAVKNSVIRYYRVPADRVTVVYRGVDLARMTPASEPEVAALRASIAPGGAWPLLLNVGRLTRQKGQESLIRAMPRIRQAFPRAVALFAGLGELKPSYRTLARSLGVEQAVVFLGLRADVPRLLQASDLFVFPSLYEGAGIALIEAMAMAKPIAASATPAVVEVGGDAVVLTPVADADRLADAVIGLAAAPMTWADLGARARRRVQTHFDIAVNAAAFGDLCERVVHGGRAVRPPAMRAAGL